MINRTSWHDSCIALVSSQRYSYCTLSYIVSHPSDIISHDTKIMPWSHDTKIMPWYPINIINVTIKYYIHMLLSYHECYYHLMHLNIISRMVLSYRVCIVNIISCMLLSYVYYYHTMQAVITSCIRLCYIQIVILLFWVFRVSRWGMIT